MPCCLTLPNQSLADSVRYLLGGFRASQPDLLHLHVSSKFESPVRCSMFGPSVRSTDLLYPLLTSATSSRHLTMTVARGKVADLPGYCAPTFSLMPAAYTSRFSVQVWDFEDIGLLIQPARLICDSCSSGQRFACGFLQIPPHDGHPCRPANDSPCWARKRLSLSSGCALPGAP
mgnify:CR=1 FL=1